MTHHFLPEFDKGVAIVAGGSGGIGAAIVKDLAASGSDVAFTYHSSQAKAEAAAAGASASGRSVSFEAVDLQDAARTKAFVDAAVDRHGGLHSVVYAAGPALPMKFINQLDPETWARIFRADVEGCFNLVWACLPHLKAQKSGSIAAVVTAAVDRPPPRDILSAAPKAAIQALIRGVAKEEGRFGIRANCVGPGWIDAGLGSAVMGDINHADYIEKFLTQIPLRKVGEGEDIAKAVTFVLSDAARYITGATIPVAGGLQL